MNDFWLNAGRRNIEETTTTARRSRFMRRLPCALDHLDIALCVFIGALVLLFVFTP